MNPKHALLACALVSLTACGGEQDAAVAENVIPSAPVQTGQVLPIRDETATPASGPAASGKTMPAALHGRWGLTPADCAATTRNANGLIAITADEIRFYESVAKPDKIRSQSDTEIQGEFAFTGEGMSWSGPMSWSIAGDKLTRVDSEADSRLVYTRCSGPTAPIQR